MAASVYIYSHDHVDAQWRVNGGRLADLHAKSDQSYRLVQDPEVADVILLGNPFADDLVSNAELLALVERYCDKCFVISEQDIPCFEIRGVYTSLGPSWLTRRRVAGGGYLAFHGDFFNPVIGNHPYSLDDYRRRRYLCSFVGRVCHAVRIRLMELRFASHDVLIEDTSASFDLWSDTSTAGARARQVRYAEVLLDSKFALCPRGAGTSSFRLFEAMALGVVPVIISDAWVAPTGPDWDTFSIRIKERDVGKLEMILAQHESRYQEMGMRARDAYLRWFAEDAYFNFLVSGCLALKAQELIPERYYWKNRKAIARVQKLTLAIGYVAEQIRRRVRPRARLAQLFNVLKR